jgi:anti-sigma factor RsiW
MECGSSRTILALYADGELDAAESEAFERHLQACATCRQVLAAERALKAALRAMPRPAMPPTLAARVRAALPQAAPRRPARPWFRLAPALAAGLALFLIGGALGRFVLAPPAADLAARDVASAHIRALVSDRITDVASSERHTVKPWFNGRVELAPLVEDFAAEGFPLVGGRIDFVEGRRAATVVYRRRQHLISLFIWPSSAAVAGTTSIQGYNVVQWSSNGMGFAAISDLNRAELETFIGLVKARGAQPAATKP